MDKKERIQLAKVFNRRLNKAVREKKTNVRDLLMTLGHAPLNRKAGANPWLPHAVTITELAYELGLTCDYLLGLTDRVEPDYLAGEWFGEEEMRFSFCCRFNDVFDEKMLTQIDFGKQMGSATITVIHWLEGDYIPDTFCLVRFCRNFGYSFDYMLGLTEERLLPGPYVP